MCSGQPILRYGFDLKICDSLQVYNVNLEYLGQEYIVFHGLATVCRASTHEWISTVENLTGSSHAFNSLWCQQELCPRSDETWSENHHSGGVTLWDEHDTFPLKHVSLSPGIIFSTLFCLALLFHIWHEKMSCFNIQAHLLIPKEWSGYHK